MIYIPEGRDLLTQDEYYEKTAEEQPGPTTIPGSFTIKRSLGESRGSLPEEYEPFTPIGLGKPLAISIDHLYTGKFPDLQWLNILHKNDIDLLVTSAVKQSGKNHAQQWAVNFLNQKTHQKQRITSPGATIPGSKYIFYTPSLLDGELLMDIRFSFDDFPDAVVTTLGSTMQEIGAMPFICNSPHGVLLLSVGILTKIGARLIERADTQPEFLSQDVLTINSPGKRKLKEGFLLVTDNRADEPDTKFLDEFYLNGLGEVVSRKDNTTKYQGDIPYAVIKLDGTHHVELQSFEPIAASTALLARFMGNKDEISKQDWTSLLEGARLTNDLYYRKLIDEYDYRINNCSDEKQKSLLKTQRDAYANNILNDIFRKK